MLNLFQHPASFPPGAAVDAVRRSPASTPAAEQSGKWTLKQVQGDGKEKRVPKA